MNVKRETRLYHAHRLEQLVLGFGRGGPYFSDGFLVLFHSAGDPPHRRPLRDLSFERSSLQVALAVSDTSQSDLARPVAFFERTQQLPSREWQSSSKILRRAGFRVSLVPGQVERIFSCFVKPDLVDFKMVAHDIARICRRSTRNSQRSWTLTRSALPAPCPSRHYQHCSASVSITTYSAWSYIVD